MRRQLCRTAAIMIAVILCACVSACDLSEYIRFIAPTAKGIPEDNSLEYAQIGQNGYAASPYYTPTVSRYSYHALNDGQRELYDGLLKNAYQVYPEKDDRYTYRMPQVIVDGNQLNKADIRLTVRALMDDNPYFFWLSQTYTILVDPESDYTAVQLYSEFEPTELKQMKARLDEVIGGFLAGVDDGLSEYEREKLVHDYVIGRCEYDDADLKRTEISPENIKSHSVYGALAEQLCVCEGYGAAVQLLLNELGVDCVTLTGMAFDRTRGQGQKDASLHLWNAVKIAGDWYHLDATWDDQEEEIQRYNYFNLNDEMLFADHTLSQTPDLIGEKTIEEKGTDELNLFIPSCQQTRCHYYIYECAHLTDYEADALKEALYSAAADKEKYFTFYIEPELDYQNTVDALFTYLPQYFFGYIEEVNGRLTDYEIDGSNLTYYTDASRRSVAVVLNYY